MANYRSYRDKTSKKLLENIALTHSDLVYPDLAFSYISRAKPKKQGTRVDRKVVGISPIAYLSQHGWPKSEIRVYENYFNTLVEFILILIKQNYSIMLFSTDGSDRKVVSDIFSAIKEDHKLDVTGIVSHPHTRTLEELFDQLSNVNYVVASRLHGILLSNLCYLPVMAISYDRKVDTYMADVGLTDYCLGIHDIEINLLLNNFELLTTTSELIKSRLIANNDNYASDLARQYDLVLKEIVNA